LATDYVITGKSAEGIDLQRIPLAASLATQILHAAEGIDPEVMARIGALDIRAGAKSSPLRTPILQKVLAIARRADRPDVIAGCINAIIGSKFLRLLDRSLAEKLLRHTTHGPILASYILHRLEAAQYIEILDKITNEVMKCPLSYPHATIKSAAAFRNEHFRVSTPPLASIDGVLTL
jgi:hypothetical protein